MMNSLLKNLIPDWYTRYKNDKQQQKERDEWEKSDRLSVPPYFIKQEIVQEFQSMYEYKILVITGSQTDNMIESQKKFFSKILAIEPEQKAYTERKQKFSQDGNVFLVQGESNVIMTKVVSTINEPAIFWISSHTDKEGTSKNKKNPPLFDELQSILIGRKFPHILLIDNAHRFNNNKTNPTIKELQAFIQKIDDQYMVTTDSDVIRVVNKSVVHTIDD